MKTQILNPSLVGSSPAIAFPTRVAAVTPRPTAFGALALALLLLLLALPGTAQAAISIAGTYGPSGWRGLNSANTISQPTFTAGIDGMLVVTVSGEFNPTNITVTYGGKTMTSAVSTNRNGNGTANTSYAGIFYLAYPGGSGSNLVVTASGAGNRYNVYAVYATGVNPVPPLATAGATNTSVALTETPYVTPTSGALAVTTLGGSRDYALAGAFSSLIYTNSGALAGQTVPANVSGSGASLSAGSWGILPNADQIKGVGNIPVPGSLEGQSEVLAVFGEAPPAAFDHLAVSNSSPQTAGVAFDVTITAQDPSNVTVNDSSTLVQVSSPSAFMEFDWNGNGIYGDNSGTLTNGVATIKARNKKAETTTITAIATGGVTTPSPSNVTIDPGTFAKLQILAPGETAAPGTASGKTGTPTARTINVSFNVTVNAVDANWNLVNTVTDTVGITSTDGAATLPANAPLGTGTGTFAVTLNTVGSFTVTATDVTDGSKTANTTPAITAQGVPLVWQGDGSANLWNTSALNWTNLAGTAVAFAVNNQVTFDNTSTNPVVDIVGTVLPNTMTVNSASNYTFSSTSGGLIGGATGLAKSGAGTLTVNTANTFTGPTTVSGGTLALSNNLALQNSVLATSTNSVTLGGGITTPTLGGLSGSTALSVFITNGYSGITALTLNVSAGTNVTYSGAITNSSMALTKTGAGTQVLSGQSTYTGPTAIQNGTVVISTPTALPVTTALTLGSGGNSGVLQLGDASATRVQTLASLTTSGSGTGNAVVGGNASVSPLTLTLASDGTYAGLLGGAGANQNNLSLVKNTNGITSPTLTLSGANTYNGGTTVNGGVLSVSNNSAAGTGTITLNNTDTALEIANGINLSCPVSIGSPGNRKLIQQQSGATSGECSGTVTIVETGAGNFAVTNGSGQTLTMSGPVVGDAAGLTKIGAGTLILTGTNTYSGLTTVSNGTLVVSTISDSGPSAISTNTLQLRGGTLRYSGAGAATTIRSVTVPVASTIDLPAGNLTLDGITSGTGGLSLSGGGTLSLGGTGDNNNLLINATAGEVQLNKASSSSIHAVAGITGIGNGATVKITGTGGDQIFNGGGANQGVNGLVAGGTLNLNGNSETISFLNGTGGIVEGGSGTPTLTVGQNNVSSSFGGVIQNTSGTLALTKNGTGTNTLSGANTYGGATTISGGTLALSGAGSIGNSPLIDVNASATLDVSAVTGTYVLGAAQTLKGSGTVTGAVMTVNGQITPGGGIGTLTFSAPPTLSGTIVMELNTAVSPSNDVINVTSGTLAAGGALVITNLPGSTLAVSNSFKLFSQPVSGSFSSIVYPPAPTNTAWANLLSVNGSIALVSTITAPTPTNITVSVSGGNVILDWPAGQGWQLQAQTNSLTVGINTNWVTVPGAVPPVTNAVAPANDSVFYRLVYP